MEAQHDQHDTLLEVEDLLVAFGGVHALDGVDLTVARGSITGLIGPNGAGKTTLIDAVTGFVSPTRGSIRFAGRDVTGLAPSRRAELGLVRTFQSLELFEDLGVGDNLRVAAEPEPWWGILVEAIGRDVSTTVEADISWALGLMGLDHVGEALPSELSHGQRRLVSVARALAARPELLLLDEPAAGLDTTETELLGEHLGLLPDAGVTMLLIDHDMGLVLDICTHLHVLDFGHVIATGSPEEVRTDPAVIAAYLGAPT
ncbi:MAG TPA: ABC transporter ATP-binding protein [Acidimicrobiales bacterium]|nr:ABC transporter ATP-binding protein [Acidimicrobiales bacterium]